VSETHSELSQDVLSIRICGENETAANEEPSNVTEAEPVVALLTTQMQLWTEESNDNKLLIDPTSAPKLADTRFDEDKPCPTKH
jgi:hypothetical protein